MQILGVNAYHGDSSAALLRDGRIVCAIEEERINRIKHWAGLPLESIRFCLNQAGEQVQHLAIARNPRAHLYRKLVRAASTPSAWGRLLGRARNSLEITRLPDQLRERGVSLPRNARFHMVEHHRAHLASAFFVSPFEEAAVVSVDGFGDYSSAMWGIGKGNRIQVLGTVTFPHSLGIFYTAFTQFLGFPKYGDEYKMMGLAAYGDPQPWKDRVSEVVRTTDGNIRLNLKYFTHHSRGVDMTWAGGEPVLGPVYSDAMAQAFGEPRVPRSEILPGHSDMAAAVQSVLEDNYFALLNHVQKVTGCKQVCLAGGVALNCAANGKLFDKTPFTGVYIQGAAHDAGVSLGAALYVHHQVLQHERSFEMRHAYLGPEYSDEEIESVLRLSGATFARLSMERLIDSTAQEIADGKIVGWFQGRMEFGPRALGSRSILADPRRADMKDILNSRIKLREPFRPFCPSILSEAVGEFFEVDHPSPFMVQAYKIRPDQQARIPAVTHADGTGRLQTVEKDSSPLYWRLINRFGEITGVPVLLNTSFNENEPIVNSPQEALDCFLRTRMDTLVIGSYIVRKQDNPDANLQRGVLTGAQTR